MKTLIAGWFSFEGMGASAGDLLVHDLVCEWLDGDGVEYDVALAAPFGEGVDWRRVDPAQYTHVVFLCGPFGNGPPVDEFLKHFGQCRFLGLNLSMLEPLDRWNPFVALFERDSSKRARPDMAFLARQHMVPVVGVARIDAQPEYKSRDLHEHADEAIDRLLNSRNVAVVPIDTRLDLPRVTPVSAATVESTIARMDALITTRLHGLVLALKNGVPALVIDSVVGGGKVSRQAATIGWPVCFTVPDLDDDALCRALDYCLTDGARKVATDCRTRAVEYLTDLQARFLDALHGSVDAVNDVHRS